MERTVFGEVQRSSQRKHCVSTQAAWEPLSGQVEEENARPGNSTCRSTWVCKSLGVLFGGRLCV